MQPTFTLSTFYGEYFSGAGVYTLKCSGLETAIIVLVVVV